MQEFIEMLRRAQEADGEGKPRLSNEAQIVRLKELVPAFTQPCPFKVGDVVTPRSDAPVKAAGSPHVVVAVRETDHDFSHGEPGSNGFGAKFDVRVIHYHQGSGQFCAHWVESADFMPFTE